LPLAVASIRIAPQFREGPSEDPTKEAFSFVELVRRVQSNAHRYTDVIAAAADHCITEMTKDAVARGEPETGGQALAVGADGTVLAAEGDDVFDVLAR
jgi:hypothetical protein